MLHIDSAGAGPPLILLHGFALHAGLFAPLLPELARHFRVHAVDLPGHGFSPAATANANTNTLDQFVAEVAGAFAAQREPLTVLGWSLGGAIAMRWAMLEPARVGKLALVCTTPRFVTAPDWPHAMDPRTLAQLRTQLFERGEPASHVLAATLALLAHIDLRSEVGAIRVPTLVEAMG